MQDMCGNEVEILRKYCGKYMLSHIRYGIMDGNLPEISNIRQVSVTFPHVSGEFPQISGIFPSGNMTFLAVEIVGWTGLLGTYMDW